MFFQCFLLVSLFAVSGHATPPSGSPPGHSKPKPELLNVTATGAIKGTGAPANIAITLTDTFQGTDVNRKYREESGSFIANPDYPPAFKVSGNNRHQRLSYYYCDAGPHIDEQLKDGICDENPSDESGHDPLNYKILKIFGGIRDKKTGDIVFPTGSRWVISWKDTMATLIEGTLDMEVTLVTEWSNP